MLDSDVDSAGGHCGHNGGPTLWRDQSGIRDNGAVHREAGELAGPTSSRGYLVAVFQWKPSRSFLPA
jgi:hypothetical protein